MRETPPGLGPPPRPAPRPSTGLARAATRAFARLAGRPARSCAAVGLIGFLMAAAPSILVRWPVPIQHDEFSYLLAADTFAHGRPANPTHPLWAFFETMHVIQRPTSASKYPPGQGLLLAIGRAIGGDPIVGAWVGAGLAAAAIAWMLRARLPPRWALLGGLIAAAHPTLHAWSQSYWGGALSATGGALLLGALARVAARPNPVDGARVGLGLLILANTRPCEGFVLAAISGLALLARMASGRGPRPLGLIAWVAPAVLLVLAPGAAGMALYNRAVTGDPLVMPYVVHEATYASAPLFLWQPIGPPKEYRHRAIADFQQDWALRPLRGPRTIPALLAGAGPKFASYASAYFPILAVPACRSLGDLRGLVKRNFPLLLLQVPPAGPPPRALGPPDASPPGDPRRVRGGAGGGNLPPAPLRGPGGRADPAGDPDGDPSAGGPAVGRSAGSRSGPGCWSAWPGWSPGPR